MKIRMHGDSIRVRLSQAEVSRLARGEELREATRFAGGGTLTTAILPDGDAGLTASFAEGCITVRVPAAQVTEWSGNDVEGLYGEGVAVEKDYACLHRDGDVNRGTFPNPAAGPVK